MQVKRALKEILRFYSCGRVFNKCFIKKIINISSFFHVFSKHLWNNNNKINKKHKAESIFVCAYNHCQTAVTRWQKCYTGQTPEPLLLAEESSLWNLTLNLPKIPPNMRICPQKVAAAFVVVLSGSDFLKWKSFTFSDQLECLPSTHQRASEDLDRNPESMHLSELMKQKMHYRRGKKRGNIFCWKLLTERKDFNSFFPNFVYLSSQEKKNAVVSQPVMHSNRLLFYTKWERLHIKRCFFEGKRVKVAMDDSLFWWRRALRLWWGVMLALQSP